MKDARAMRYVIIVVVAWLFFWWGAYVGELNATAAWLATERNNLQTLLLLKRTVDMDSAAAKVLTSQIDAKKVEVHQLEEAKEFSIVHFTLFPLLGPIRPLALASL